MFRRRPRRLSPFHREPNPAQARDSARAWEHTAVGVVVVGAAATAFTLPGPSAPPTSGDVSVTVATGSGQPLEGAGAVGVVVPPVTTR